MTIEIRGKMLEDNEDSRRATGLYSFDQSLKDEALGTTGIPLRVGIEIFGPKETAKSTIAYYLAGCVESKGGILLLDLEHSARETYFTRAIQQSGFEGTVDVIDHVSEKGKIRAHEDMLEEATTKLLTDDSMNVVLLDSVGIVTPRAERAGKLGESFMGRRAQVMAQFTRDFVAVLGFVDRPTSVILVNHGLKSYDGNYYYAPGGDTKGFGCRLRLRTQRKDILSGGSFEINTLVDKLTLGGRGDYGKRTGTIITVPGVGVSPELTMVFDCFLKKIAKREKGTGMVSVLDKPEGKKWLKIAKISTLEKRVKEGKLEQFDVFKEMMEWGN